MQTQPKNEEEAKKTGEIGVYRFHKMMEMEWDPEMFGFFRKRSADSTLSRPI
jgi:hypothetical protein